MAIEGAFNFITDLEPLYPLSGDGLNQADDHMRGIKNAIQGSFSAFTGIAVTATEAELNLLTGKSLASADDVIDNFPAGTIMSFQQTAAPTGWTKEVTHDNKALRVVTGAAGSGGTNSFTGVLNGSVNVSGTILNANQIPAHSHGAGSLSAVSNGAHTHTYSGVNTTVNGTARSQLTNNAETNTPSTNSAGAHTHSITGSTANNSTSGSSHNHNFNLDVQYVDLILAAKD